MQNSKLAAQLQDDAAHDVPPFGAESVKMARRSGASATGLLLEHIDSDGGTAFLALEALREADHEAYDSLPASQRSRIYVDDLLHRLFYNAWGLPGCQLTETAYALLSLGDEAISLLKPLLGDQRIAPLSGSAGATASHICGNRVCDYAWVFINEIRHQHYSYSQNPAERDQEISKLRQEL